MANPSPQRIGDEDTATRAGFGPDDVKPITPIQAAGLWAALAVGAIILTVIVLVGIFWLTHAPAAPQLQGAGLDAKLLSDYQSLLKSAREEALAVFQAIAVQALLPVLTLILGYVFGSQKNA